MELIQQISQSTLELKYENIIFCNINENVIGCENMIILLAKQFLYRWKCCEERISVRMVENEIDFIKQMELQIAKDKGFKQME